MSDTLVSGIFLHIQSLEQTIREKSPKWMIAVFLLSLFSLLLVSTLIGLALVSHTGLGIQIVVGTFILGLSIFLMRVLQKLILQVKPLSKRSRSIVFVGLAAFVCMIGFWIGYFMIPSEAPYFSISLLQGGIILSALFFLLKEGYPRLSEHGTPGFLTTAGFLIVFGITYMTAVSRYIVPYDPFSLNVGPLLSPPSADFPLGTTALGQDMLSRTIAGGAIMLQVAIISVTVCFSIGVPIGLIASYKGGFFDRVVSLIMDSIFAFPGLVLAIAIAAIFSPGVLTMALAITVVYIPSYFRVVRSQVLTVKELPYVEAAIVMGARDRDILLRYVFPNVLPSAVVVLSINFADAVLTAAGLTFIGLGLPIDVPDWGWDLTMGRSYLQFGAWWVITYPGIMVVLLALGFTLIGEGLNEILTPRLRE